MTWALPVELTKEWVNRLVDHSAQLDCEQSPVAYDLVDLDGDGRVELVVTGACPDYWIGRTSWWVFEASDSGFDTPHREMTLPKVSSSDDRIFEDYHGRNTSCDVDGGPGRYTEDMNGDAIDDLVVTDDCADLTLGDTHWNVAYGACDL